MGCSPNASLQYGFLVDEDNEGELYHIIEKMVADKTSKLFGKVKIEYYGTDGYTGICIYADRSKVSAYYAECGFELTPLISKESEFKKTMEDFCVEHNISCESGWCLTANYV